MAKATITLPDGTRVEINGSPEEVARVVALYHPAGQNPAPQTKKAPRKRRKTADRTGTHGNEAKAGVDWAEIINLMKTCEEFDAIETQILDRTNRLHRVLLPLFIVYKYLDNKYGLTSGDVDKITTELGVRVSVSNASKVLKSASKYVLADSVRVPGVPTRYKLSRRGAGYMEEVISEHQAEH